MGQSSEELTGLLVRWRDGDQAALERLIPLVYAELRMLARKYLAGERTGHTLEPTALVHEAYVRLVLQSMPRWQNRSHFFAVAAHLMRQVLVDHARRSRAAKRDVARKVPLHEVAAMLDGRSTDLLDLNDALDQLASFDPRKAQLVEMKFFAGLGVNEIAEAVSLSEQKVYRELKLAEAWLCHKLTPSPAA